MILPMGILLTLLVLAVAIVVAIVYGASRWRVGTKALRAQLRATRVPITPATYAPRELEGLPPPVQRYFRAVLTEGQPIVAAVRVAHAGQFLKHPLIFTPRRRFRRTRGVEAIVD